MKTTIRDVAKKANVSVATVSRVINNKGYVYEDTKKLVMQTIDELGFEPNQLARSLTNRHSRIIGVIVPHLGTSFYGQLIEGIEEAASSHGYKVMLCNTQDDEQREIDYLKIFEQYSVEGLIIASNFHCKEKLKDIDIPIVSVDHFLNENIPSITSNNEDGGRRAAKKLIEDGCTSLLLLRGPSFLITVQERTKGFIDEIEKYGLTCDIHDFDLINPDSKFIADYLKNNPHVNGIFAMADSLAIVTLGILQKLGRKIPEEVELVGFDDVNYTKWTTPSISTISQPIKYMGNESFSTLIKLINNELIVNFHRNVEIEFKQRGTTK